MRIKTALIGAVALAASAVPFAASAQIVSFGISTGYSRPYYGTPYGYGYDGYDPYRNGRPGYYASQRGWDHDRWDRDRREHWHHDHHRDDRDRWDR